MAGEIIKDLIGKLILIIIILAFCGYAAAVSPEPEEEAICKFPCKFPDPVYHHSAVSVKYDWIKKHGKHF